MTAQFATPGTPATRRDAGSVHEEVPGWVLPAIGGLVFAALILIWFTSAYWFF
jgi:hypothetical protein